MGEDSITTGMKFKLKLDKETKTKLDNYFDEYGKAIRFATNVIQKELADDKFAGKARLDENKKPLLDENGKKTWDFPEEFCSCGNNVHRYVNRKPFCQECYKNKFTENGIRKRMYSAKGRKAEHQINIKNTTSKISPTHLQYAIREAYNLDKSVKKQRKKRYDNLRKLKIKLQEFIDMREGKNILLPRKQGSRVDRFIHPSWKNKEKNLDAFRGYSISIIGSKIKILDRNIKREEKSLKEKGKINFKAKKLMLHNSIKFLEGNKVSFTLFKKEEYDLDLPKNNKKLNWLKERIELIREQKPKYAYLLRNDRGFFLQYTLETPFEINENYSGAIGIDRGISHIAVCTFVSNDGKNEPPKFFSSSEILRLRNLQKERDRYLRGKHNKIRKKKTMRNIEPRINIVLHQYSKEIVDFAKKKNAFIVFEDLQKILKSRVKMSKKLQYKLSLFTFKKLSDLIDYKAKREGIKVDYVPPENTSIECSRCGEKVDTQRPFNGNASLFKCNKCGIQLNADYNASINIAKKSLNMFDS
jgi:IS605 OrfB family transposase